MALRQRPAGSTGRKPRRDAPPPKVFQQKIPSHDEVDLFHGEDNDIVEKLKGRPVAELRGLLASLKGKHRPGLQMMIVKEILTAQRKARSA